MKIPVDHIAHLARLRLGQEEKDILITQLNSILAYVEKLRELHTTGIEPTSHVLPMGNVTRRDEVKPSLPRDKALRNAPERGNDCYRVPKIIE